MKELKKDLEKILKRFYELEEEVERESEEPELYEYITERLSDIVGCMEDMVDSMDRDKFWCVECGKYFSLECRDNRIEDEGNICISCVERILSEL